MGVQDAVAVDVSESDEGAFKDVLPRRFRQGLLAELKEVIREVRIDKLLGGQDGVDQRPTLGHEARRAYRFSGTQIPPSSRS